MVVSDVTNDLNAKKESSLWKLSEQHLKYAEMDTTKEKRCHYKSSLKKQLHCATTPKNTVQMSLKKLELRYIYQPSVPIVKQGDAVLCEETSRF